MSTSPKSEDRGLERWICLKIYCTEIGKYIHLRAKHCKKYRLYGKKAVSKNCLELNSLQKKSLGTHAYFLLPGWS